MTRILEQCNGTIKDGLCMKCFNRAATSSSICTQMYEVEDKKAPVLDAATMEDEYIKVAIKELVSLKNKIWNRAVAECIISIRENFQFMGGNVTKQEVIDELEQLKKK